MNATELLAAIDSTMRDLSERKTAVDRDDLALNITVRYDSGTVTVTATENESLTEVRGAGGTLEDALTHVRDEIALRLNE